MASRGGGPKENFPVKILWTNKIPNENRSGNAPKNNATSGNPR